MATIPRPRHVLPQPYPFNEAADFIRDSEHHFVVVNLNATYATAAKIDRAVALDMLVRAELADVTDIALGFSHDPSTIYIGK